MTIQDADPDSVLTFYRRALALRRQLQSAQELTWHAAPAHVLHFSRPGGWHVLTNFGTTPADLPEGEVMLSSHRLAGGRLPAGTTAWLRIAD